MIEGCGDVLWVSCCDITTDCQVALPVRYADAAVNAINGGKAITFVTEAQAEEINMVFVKSAPKAEKYLEDMISKRWAMIDKWRTERRAALSQPSVATELEFPSR